MGIITAEKLRKSRRFVLVLLMVSAALITPGGDPVSLCILTIPLYILFELSILVGSLIERRNSTNSDGEAISSGITGSVFLILCILLLGGLGAWLYRNWDQAEALLLDFDLTSDNKEKVIETAPMNDIVLPEEAGYFLLELTPILKDKNSSHLEQPTQFRARIHKQ